MAVLYLLSRAGDRGCPVDRLTRAGRYGGEPAGQREQLARDLGHLRTLGWEIDNIGAEGESAQYRLVAHDNRLRVQFSAAERVELQRCARMARLRPLADDLAPDADRRASMDVSFTDLAIELPAPSPALGAALEAIGQGRRLGFTYFGRRRDVVPLATYDRSGAWYLVADDAGSQKTFRVDRMSDVGVGGPTVAPRLPPERGPALDPLSWQREEVVAVRVATTVEHRPQVVAMLGRPVSDEVVDDRVVVTIQTADTAVFLQRLCQLGERVRLVGPEPVRRRLRAQLRAVAEA